MAKKQFMTRAQRDWKPGTVKKPRSTKVMFASTILVLEAFTIFFGTLAVFGLHFNDPSTVKIIIWVAGLVLAGACMVLPAKLIKPWDTLLVGCFKAPCFLPQSLRYPSRSW